MKRTLLIVALVLVSSSAFAGTPFGPNCEFSFDTANIVDLYVVPDGTGDLLSDEGLEIEIWLKDSSGNPIANYPGNEVFLGASWESAHSTYFFCYNPVLLGIQTKTGAVGSGYSDSNGKLVLDGSFLAGGIDHSAYTFFVGFENESSASEFSIDNFEDYFSPVSSDFNGDFYVNLTDTQTFSNYFFSNNLLADFDHDGNVNLSDVAIFSAANGASCP